jgi:CYTH domain-containing protein
MEREKKLISSEYAQYELMKALNTDKIIKDRQYFLYDDQYFSFDTFTYPKHRLQPGDIGLMEIEKTYPDQEVRIPSFMEVENVTDDRRYSNAAIA